VLGAAAAAAQEAAADQRKAEQIRKALAENRLKLAYQSIAALDQLERHQAGLGLHNRAEEIEDVEYHEFGRDRLAAPEAPTIGKDAPDAAEPPAAAPKPSTVCGNELITDEVRGDLAVAIDASAICATSVGSSWEDVMPPIDSSNGIAPDASEPHEGPVPAD